MRVMFEAIIGMFVGLIVLFAIISMIATQKPTSETKETVQKIEQVKSSQQVISDSTKILECLDTNDTTNDMKCFQQDEEHKTVATQTSSNFMLVADKLIETKFFIQFIFGFILLTLVMQLVLFIESFYPIANRNTWIEAHKYNISEASTNLPSVLGVAATLFAFGIFAAISSSSGDMMTLFRANVFDAVTTTIYGVLVYAINSLLHIKIAQEEA